MANRMKMPLTDIQIRFQLKDHQIHIGPVLATGVHEEGRKGEDEDDKGQSASSTGSNPTTTITFQEILSAMGLAIQPPSNISRLMSRKAHTEPSSCVCAQYERMVMMGARTDGITESGIPVCDANIVIEPKELASGEVKHFSSMTIVPHGSAHSLPDGYIIKLIEACKSHRNDLLKLYNRANTHMANPVHSISRHELTTYLPHGGPIKLPFNFGKSYSNNNNNVPLSSFYCPSCYPAPSPSSSLTDIKAGRQTGWWTRLGIWNDVSEAELKEAIDQLHRNDGIKSGHDIWDDELSDTFVNVVRNFCVIRIFTLDEVLRLYEAGVVVENDDGVVVGRGSLDEMMGVLELSDDDDHHLADESEEPADPPAELLTGPITSDRKGWTFGKWGRL